MEKSQLLDDHMYYEPDSNQIVIKMNCGGDMQTVKQKCESFIKSCSLNDSNRLNNSLIEDLNNSKLHTDVRKACRFSDPRSQHESIEDEDCTSESFKQYQRECDEIMCEKPEQNPYDVQLTSEFNYSNNDLNIKHYSSGFSRDCNKVMSESGNFCMQQEVMNSTPYSQVGRIKDRYDVKQQFSNSKDMSFHPIEVQYSNNLSCKNAVNFNEPMRIENKVISPLRNPEEYLSDEEEFKSSTNFSASSPFHNQAKKQEARRFVSEEYMQICENVKERCRQYNELENSQMEKYKQQEEQLYQEINEINKVINNYKISKSHELSLIEETFSEIKQRKINFNQSIEKRNKDLFEISFSSPLEQRNMQNVVNNSVAIVKNFSPNETGCMNKLNEEVIINHKYSIRNVADGNNFKPSITQTNMSKIQDKLLKQNKLHYDESLQNKLISKLRAESFSNSYSNVLRQKPEVEDQPIIKPQREDPKQGDKQGKHKKNNMGICTISDVK